MLSGLPQIKLKKKFRTFLDYTYTVDYRLSTQIEPNQKMRT